MKKVEILLISKTAQLIRLILWQHIFLVMVHIWNKTKIKLESKYKLINMKNQVMKVLKTEAPNIKTNDEYKNV